MRAFSDGQSFKQYILGRSGKAAQRAVSVDGAARPAGSQTRQRPHRVHQHAAEGRNANFDLGRAARSAGGDGGPGVRHFEAVWGEGRRPHRPGVLGRHEKAAPVAAGHWLQLAGIRSENLFFVALGVNLFGLPFFLSANFASSSMFVSFSTR